MASKARKAFLTTASILLLATVANAQQAPNQAGAAPEGPRPIELTQTPPTAYRPVSYTHLTLPTNREV